MCLPKTNLVSCITQAKEYRKAAEQGYASAQYNIGVMHNNGEGVLQNKRKAAEWYRKAAHRGDSQAQNDLGIMYATGQGVVQDYREAYIWFILAAKSGLEQPIKNREMAASVLTAADLRQAQEEAKRRLAEIDARRGAQ